MSFRRARKPLALSSLLLVAGSIGALPSGAQVLDRHPLFGRDILGNRAEVVTLGRTPTDSIPLSILDFESDALSPAGSPVYLTPATPGGFTDSLVAYWSFDTGFAATHGGSTFDGVETGAEIDTTEGRFGRSAYFERANLDYITIGSPVVTRGEDHTYSVWYRGATGDVLDGERQFLLETTGPGGEVGYAVSYGLRDPAGEGSDIGQVYTLWPGPAAANMSFDNAWPDGWQNVIVTYDADAALHSVYWNGRLMNTMASSDSLSEVAGLIIGAHRDPQNASDDRHWDGWIDDVAFWNRVLDEDEISALQSHAVLGPYPQFQQLDLAAGDFDGDDRDDVVAVYGVETADPFHQDVWVAVAKMENGSVDWADPATTWTDLAIPDAHIPPGSSVAPGNLRIVAGNFDEDDDASEFAVVVGHDENVSGDATRWDLWVFEIDPELRIPSAPELVWGGEVMGTDGTPHRDSERVCLAAGDLDGDEVDELVVAQNSVGSTVGSHAIHVLRLENGAWIMKAGQTSSSGGWPQATWDTQPDYGHGTNGSDRPRIDCATGIVRSGTHVVPYLLVAAGHRDWNADRRITHDAKLWLLMVDTGTSPDWTITYERFMAKADLTSAVQPHWRVTSPPVGVATGDLDFDGSDEFVWRATSNVSVSDVVYSAGSLTAYYRAGTLGWPDSNHFRYNDASHRVVQIVDLDASAGTGDWQPEILYQEWGQGYAGPKNPEIHVLRPVLTAIQTDPDTLWQVSDLTEVCSATSPTMEIGSTFAMLATDLDGDAYRIGPPLVHTDVAEVVPVVILNAPPIHFDVMPPDTFDLSGCVTGPSCDFVATYFDTSSVDSTVTTEFRQDWGLDATLSADTGPLGEVGFQLSASLEATYGLHFEHVEGRNLTVSSSTYIEAWEDDQILLSSVTFDVYEYPVLAKADADTGHLVVVVPASHAREWVNSTKYVEDYLGVPSLGYPLPHEVKNLLSYPGEDGLGVNSIDEFHADTWNVGTSGSSSFALTWTEVQSTSTRREEESGLNVSASVGALGGEASLSGSYGTSATTAFKNTVTSGISVSVQAGHLDGPFPSDAGYSVHPFVYWRDGALVVDYEVEPETSEVSTTWWEAKYDRPDPAFILPNRLENPTDPIAKLFSPDLTIDPTFAHVGETVRVTARVHNFSLIDMAQPIGVDFYLGNPDLGGVWIGCDSTEVIAARESDVVWIDHPVLAGAPDTVRVYAVLGVGALDQVHTINDRASVLLGTNGSAPGVDAPTKPTVAVFALHQNAPNPFGGRTTFRFSLPEKGRTSLRIYDVTGRLVRTVVDSDVPPGAHEFSWNGLDRGGRRVSSGVYFYRLESETRKATRKMVCLR